ncbi:MAG: hypothetical protein JF587_22795, partial [Catenulisporales bacterium]|nr:hypothetical protein [Catenulisporales bacterium]
MRYGVGQCEDGLDGPCRGRHQFGFVGVERADHAEPDADLDLGEQQLAGEFEQQLGVVEFVQFVEFDESVKQQECAEQHEQLDAEAQAVHHTVFAPEHAEAVA